MSKDGTTVPTRARSHDRETGPRPPLRFAKGLTQTRIAARIGLSQTQVSRIMRRSLDRLRILVGADPDPGPT
jgi:hypothetical protein